MTETCALQEERLAKTNSEYGSRLAALTSDLLLFEARLSRKQRAIGELLDQRECLIERQQHIIRCLHSRLADFGVVAVADGSDDGNVDDSDSAVIMEEDECSSQADGSEQRDEQQQHPDQGLDQASDRVAVANAAGGGGTGGGGGGPQQQHQLHSTQAVAADGRETDGRGNVTATYNRVMSNHRSVTKPKDVKYKRINKAKSKSLEELRGRLKNWVDRGNRMSLTVDPTYG